VASDAILLAAGEAALTGFGFVTISPARCQLCTQPDERLNKLRVGEFVKSGVDVSSAAGALDKAGEGLDICRLSLFVAVRLITNLFQELSCVEMAFQRLRTCWVEIKPRLNVARGLASISK